MQSILLSRALYWEQGSLTLLVGLKMWRSCTQACRDLTLPLMKEQLEQVRPKPGGPGLG